MQGNQDNIIGRLFNSFTELEVAIDSARKTLVAKGFQTPEILNRLSSYDSILSKQRTLAGTLAEAISKGNWDEVSRQVGLINGLSAMIRDDARAILSSLALVNEPQAEEGEVNVC